jgi:retron-type reverse transcriptase
VVQQAALLIPEPIFESDFLDSSYGFRPGRSAHDALREIRGHSRIDRVKPSLIAFISHILLDCTDD